MNNVKVTGLETFLFDIKEIIDIAYQKHYKI